MASGAPQPRGAFCKRQTLKRWHDVPGLPLAVSGLTAP